MIETDISQLTQLGSAAPLPSSPGEAVLERAAQHGLDGVAFTETNTQDGCDELFDLQPKTPLRILVGLELATDRGQYLCFFPRPEEVPEPV